jgi:FeS assembly SUF system protein
MEAVEVVSQAGSEYGLDGQSVGTGSQPVVDMLEERVIEAMRTVKDPEIPVNIYDLGLIYDLHIGEEGTVDVRMTLTAPACPVAGTLPGMVEDAIRGVEDVTSASVELVWDPPWSVERMSEEARLELGLL